MGFKGNWQKVKDSDLFELVKLAQKEYPNFNYFPEDVIRKIFETYKETTYIFVQRNEIKGFGLYQEWPDCLNMIMMCLPFSKERNMRILLQGRSLLPDKKIVWWDEDEMKAKGI